LCRVYQFLMKRVVKFSKVGSKFFPLCNSDKIVFIEVRFREWNLLKQFQRYGQQYIIRDFVSHVSGSCDARMLQGYSV